MDVPVDFDVFANMRDLMQYVCGLSLRAPPTGADCRVDPGHGADVRGADGRARDWVPQNAYSRADARSLDELQNKGQYVVGDKNRFIKARYGETADTSGITIRCLSRHSGVISSAQCVAQQCAARGPGAGGAAGGAAAHVDGHGAVGGGARHGHGQRVRAVQVRGPGRAPPRHPGRRRHLRCPARQRDLQAQAAARQERARAAAAHTTLTPRRSQLNNLVLAPMAMPQQRAVAPPRPRADKRMSAVSELDDAGTPPAESTAAESSASRTPDAEVAAQEQRRAQELAALAVR